MTDEVESVDSLTVKLLLSSVFYLTTAYGGAFPCRNGKPFVLRTFPLSREYLIKIGEALVIHSCLDTDITYIFSNVLRVVHDPPVKTFLKTHILSVKQHQ